MIQPKDPYWRRLLILAWGGALAAGAVALVAFPLGEHGQDASTGGGASEGLNVTSVQYDPNTVNETELWMWVNVTNAAGGVASNISATISGAELSAPAPETGTANGRVARGGTSAQPIEVSHAGGLDLQLSGSGFTPAGSLALTLKSPSGKTWAGQGSGTSATLTLSAADLAAGGDGTYSATIQHTGGLRAISYTLAYTVSYPPSNATMTWDNLSQGESHQFAWLVKSTSPTEPPPATVRVDATIAGAGGAGRSAVHYTAGLKGQAASSAAASGPVFLTSGEALGFSAVGIFALSAASGALRTKGGRATSQDRARKEVTLHRVAWLALPAVVAVHAIVQIASGHLDDVGAILVGSAALGGLMLLIWFNAYQRSRVLAMEWPAWLRLKVVWVVVIVALAVAHILLFGRHFTG